MDEAFLSGQASSETCTLCSLQSPTSSSLIHLALDVYRYPPRTRCITCKHEFWKKDEPFLRPYTGVRWKVGGGCSPGPKPRPRHQSSPIRWVKHIWQCFGCCPHTTSVPAQMRNETSASHFMSKCGRYSLCRGEGSEPYLMNGGEGCSEDEVTAGTKSTKSSRLAMEWSP